MSTDTDDPDQKLKDAGFVRVVTGDVRAIREWASKQQYTGCERCGYYEPADVTDLDEADREYFDLEDPCGEDCYLMPLVTFFCQESPETGDDT